MKKILFTGIIASVILSLFAGCSKSSENYEAIYYILLTGGDNVITNNDNGDHYKNVIETALENWKAQTNTTWRHNFGSSYSEAAVQEKDQEAIAYFNERVSALKNAMKGIENELQSTSVIVHSSWHISICRDKSYNTLIPSADVHIDHE